MSAELRRESKLRGRSELTQAVLGRAAARGGLQCAVTPSLQVMARVECAGQRGGLLSYMTAARLYYAGGALALLGGVARGAYGKRRWKMIDRPSFALLMSGHSL